MKHYAVIGHPITHSLSPRIHQAFANQCGIKLTYELIDIEAGFLADRLIALHVLGYQGLNVTLPHKTRVIPLCKRVGDAARHAQAVNVLTRSGAGWVGDNTDGVGLIKDLRHNLVFDIRGKRVLVLGAGGAARGLLAPLLRECPIEVVICNRSHQAAEELATVFSGSTPVQVKTAAELDGDHFDLVLNATSAGHCGEAPVLPGDLFTTGALAYDLNYGIAAKPFLRWADDRGASNCADGLGMLVEQAAEAFFLWHGTRPLTGPILGELRRGQH